MADPERTEATLVTELEAADDALLSALQARARLAVSMGDVATLDRTRGARQRMLRRGGGPLADHTIELLFRELDAACAALTRPISVACLGPSGTYSELAARRHFGHAARLELAPSIDEVFRAVEAGSVDFGVIPVENSTEGAVGRSLDLLAHTPREVCGEVTLRIRHQLLARDPHLDLAKVTHVYSHAQSLAQCQGWLSAHLPTAERIAVASNADAARRASDTSVAIAGEHAAAPYGLAIVARDLQDEPDNTTRFVVLGDKRLPRTGDDRTSLLVSARNEAGAVHALLGPLAKRAVSMTRFESRPSRAALWEYLFFIDLDGHRDDAPVAEALLELGRMAGYLKVLGSYPKAVQS